MAQIDNSQHRWVGDLKPWTTTQTRAQFAAIALLRWRIFRNGLRRKSGIGDLIATIIMIPIFAAIVIGPAIGSGILAYLFAHKGHFSYIAFILWGIFALCQLTSIQLGQPGTTFDPTQLIRFPLNFPGYATIRTFFGLLSPANAITTLMSFTVAVGVTIAVPSLWFYVFTAMIAFALANIFFTRMVFAWVDRWLSTRRAREVFTGFIVMASLGFQYLNFTFNPGLNSRRHAQVDNTARITAATNYYHHAKPFLDLLPPELTANAIAAGQASHPAIFAAEFAGIMLFASVFFAIFSIRLYKEFRGENFSDVANAVAKTPTKKLATTSTVAIPTATTAPQFHVPETISAVFIKEFITLRRNTGIFYSLIAPLVMVVLFANFKGARLPAAILFPSAVAYTMMGVAPLCYNSLGLEAAGIQFFFLAPVKMRDVFIAKNLMNIFLVIAEIFAVFVVITYISHAPSATLTASVLLWAAFTMFVSLAVGNRRSVTAPKKIDLAKMSNKQASPLSALLSIGLLLLCAGLGAGVMAAASYFELPWLLLPTMLVLAIGGFFAYTTSLASMDKLLADNRDTLSEVLCKA